MAILSNEPTQVMSDPYYPQTPPPDPTINPATGEPWQQTVGSLDSSGNPTVNTSTGSSVPEYSILNPANAANYTSGSYQPTPEQQAWIAQQISGNASLPQTPPPLVSTTASTTGPGETGPATVEPPAVGLGALAPGTGEVPGGAGPQLPQLPPPPPTPPDISGYIPNVNTGPGDQIGQDIASGMQGGMSQETGGPAAPGNISGFQSQAPAWARGLMRSPYAKFAAQGGQSAFAGTPGFAADTADPDALRRQMEAAGQLPAWAQPGI